MPDYTLYAYSGCSTCRDAVKWLRSHKIDFIEKPIYESPPSVPELKQMLKFQNGELRKLFNTSGLEYRALDLKAKLPKMTESQALELLSSNGKLVKRPFVLGKKAGLVGFKPDEWEALAATASAE
jgi:arsenate reductase (glutaredoxin)